MFVIAGVFFTFSAILFVVGSVFDTAVGGTYNIGLLNVRSNFFISASGFLISGSLFTCCGMIREALTSLALGPSKVSADPSERLVQRQEHADVSKTRTTRGSHRDLVGILQWTLTAPGHLLSQSSIDAIELAAENGYQIKYYVGNKITFKKEGYGDRSCYSESDLTILKRSIEEDAQIQ